MRSSQTTCCVVGGGPAGVMLGYLLARSGVRVTVLEKHKDFLRDFRGDTVHPSTLEVLHELDLLGDFLRLPHQKVSSARVVYGGVPFEIADMSGLKTRCPFVALMPQWDFLNFLSAKGARYSEFDLRMESEAIDLIEEENRITGVIVRKPNGSERIDANLVVACDGRHSTVRTSAGLQVDEIGVPIDVLWFRIGKDTSESAGHVLGNVNYGKVLVLIDRGDYYQAGLIIRKDSFGEIREAGLDAFRTTISRIVPMLESRAEELNNWDQVKLLSVRINRLRRWSRPGLLCIGDAAHAMSPAFGVGINLAIQDAVASANLLADGLRRGQGIDGLLGRIQARREFPTRVTQMLQVLAHKGFESVFRQKGAMRPPLPMKIAVRIPGVQKAVARVVGIGVRPEHVRPSISGTRRACDEPWLRRVAALCVGVSTAASVAWRGLW